jgi:hypothetical protein
LTILRDSAERDPDWLSGIFFSQKHWEVSELQVMPFPGMKRRTDDVQEEANKRLKRELVSSGR